jgi:CheY-like chemotaxis protein
LRRILSNCEVKVVESARDALAILRSGRHYDAILCDIMMAGMTGMDLYRVVAVESPAYLPRIVYVTGGSFTPWAREFLARIPNPWLEKPFAARAVLATLQKLMSAPGATA